jgi:hypothetical protein
MDQGRRSSARVLRGGVVLCLTHGAQMSGKTCAVCQKTAYPIEAIREGDRTWHKLCFRCSVCKGTLNLKNFKLRDGNLFCHQHYPTDTATSVADDVTTRHAQNAPQKKAEGLATVRTRVETVLRSRADRIFAGVQGRRQDAQGGGRL